MISTRLSDFTAAVARHPGVDGKNGVNAVTPPNSGPQFGPPGDQGVTGAAGSNAGPATAGQNGDVIYPPVVFVQPAVGANGTNAPAAQVALVGDPPTYVPSYITGTITYTLAGNSYNTTVSGSSGVVSGPNASFNMSTEGVYELAIWWAAGAAIPTVTISRDGGPNMSFAARTATRSAMTSTYLLRSSTVQFIFSVTGTTVNYAIYRVA